MDTPQHYRDKSAQARRLARYLTPPDVIENLERLAREYEQMAADIEKAPSPSIEAALTTAQEFADAGGERICMATGRRRRLKLVGSFRPTYEQ